MTRNLLKSGHIQATTTAQTPPVREDRLGGDLREGEYYSPPVSPRHMPIYMAISLNGEQLNNGPEVEGETARAITGNGTNASQDIVGTSANGGARGRTINCLETHIATLHAMNTL